MLRTCRKCGEEKPLELFVKRSGYPGAFQHECKQRKNARDTINQRKHLLRKRETSRRNYDPALKRAQRDRDLLNPEFRKKAVEMGRAYRARNPKAYKAHQLLTYAVRVRKIIPAEYCSHCGIKSQLEGHHPDYSKPLEVIWLCRKCHRKEHRKEALKLHKERK